jgi:hypothetical protein
LGWKSSVWEFNHQWNSDLKICQMPCHIELSNCWTLRFDCITSRKTCSNSVDVNLETKHGTFMENRRTHSMISKCSQKKSDREGIWEIYKDM